MKKMTYVFVMGLVLLLLAACSSPEPAADTAVGADQSGETMVADEEPMDDEMMDSEEAMDDDMMDEDSMTDESMDDESMDDEAMADESMDDEAMDDEAMDDESMADESMDDEAMDDESMDDEEMDHEDMAEAAMAEADAMVSQGQGSMSDEVEVTDESMDADDMMERPAWQEIELTNARSGETFSLADFTGQTVFVEPMATWCTNCLQQLTNVSVAKGQLSDEDTIFVALSLETNISDETLAQYADQRGFDWLFAVMTPEILQELAGEFGRVITSAPSTPHFIIRADGSYTDLVTGIESPDEILQSLQAEQA